MPYYVYILQSHVDGTFYIGYSAHPEKRLEQHNSGKATYSARKVPWVIVYLEVHENKRDAIIRERFLKNQRNRSFYLELVKNYQSTKS